MRRAILLALCLTIFNLCALAQINKNDLIRQIESRTSQGLDNADLIDRYASVASEKDLLKHEVLNLFVLKNNVNVSGDFYQIVNKNADKVISTLNISEAYFNELFAKFSENEFAKICKSGNEADINALAKAVAAIDKKSNHDLIQKEYLTKFYYITNQPLKLSVHASDYAQEVMRQNETKLTKEANSKKLNDAAKFVVESVSNKNMLNSALLWSAKASEMFASYRNYETQAYILYKLGKRSEAIESMEKACYLAKGNGNDQLGQISMRLIKMKRGEKIF